MRAGEKGGSKEGGRRRDTTRDVAIAGRDAVATDGGRSRDSRWRSVNEAAATCSDSGNRGYNERRAGSGRGMRAAAAVAAAGAGVAAVAAAVAGAGTVAGAGAAAAWAPAEAGRERATLGATLAVPTVFARFPIPKGALSTRNGPAFGNQWSWGHILFEGDRWASKCMRLYDLLTTVFEQ